MLGAVWWTVERVNRMGHCDRNKQQQNRQRYGQKLAYLLAYLIDSDKTNPILVLLGIIPWIMVEIATTHPTSLDYWLNYRLNYRLDYSKCGNGKYENLPEWRKRSPAPPL